MLNSLFFNLLLCDIDDYMYIYMFFCCILYISISFQYSRNLLRHSTTNIQHPYRTSSLVALVLGCHNHVTMVHGQTQVSFTVLHIDRLVYNSVFVLSEPNSAQDRDARWIQAKTWTWNQRSTFKKSLWQATTATATLTVTEKLDLAWYGMPAAFEIAWSSFKFTFLSPV